MVRNFAACRNRISCDKFLQIFLLILFVKSKDSIDVHVIETLLQSDEFDNVKEPLSIPLELQPLNRDQSKQIDFKTSMKNISLGNFFVTSYYVLVISKLVLVVYDKRHQKIN